jgi:hypothetical protein
MYQGFGSCSALSGPKWTQVLWTRFSENGVTVRTDASGDIVVPQKQAYAVVWVGAAVAFLLGDNFARQIV